MCCRPVSTGCALIWRPDLSANFPSPRPSRSLALSRGFPKMNRGSRHARDGSRVDNDDTNNAENVRQVLRFACGLTDFPPIPGRDIIHSALANSGAFRKGWTKFLSVSPIFSHLAWTSACNLVEAIPGAGIAQLVEHVICNLGVAGSNPAAGTSYPPKSLKSLYLG